MFFIHIKVCGPRFIDLSLNVARRTICVIYSLHLVFIYFLFRFIVRTAITHKWCSRMKQCLIIISQVKRYAVKNLLRNLSECETCREKGKEFVYNLFLQDGWKMIIWTIMYKGCFCWNFLKFFALYIIFF